MKIGAAMFFTDYSMSATELALAAEQRGFESMWSPEHSHIPVERGSAFPAGGEMPRKYAEAMDPFVVLTAAAVVTTDLKLGTGVCLVAQRDPIQTAKLVSSIDQVSDGRFLFGVGDGWNQGEMENHGTVFRTRHKLVRERIEAMKEIWTRPKAAYHGEMVRFDSMMAWPKPVQKPHPPVLVGGAYPFAARRALRYGNGWLPHRARPQYPNVRALLPEFRKLLAESGRSAADVPVSIWGSKPDLDELRRDRDAGVVRVIITFESAGADEVLPEMDKWAELIGKLD